MIKEALEYLVGLGNTRIEEIHGEKFSTQPVHLIEEPTVERLEVRSLSGLVDYLSSNFDDIISDDNRVLIHVENPTSVRAVGQFNLDAKRNIFIRAQAHLPEFAFDRFYDTEAFNIKLQSAFVDDDDRQPVIDCVSSITEENVQTTSDDGTKQVVTARTGIAEVGRLEVPNPVLLRPYRTFTEVEQPASDFVFRLKNGPLCALFEADGGAWQQEAMLNARNYLTDALSDLIEQKKIVIIS
ncbi:MAG: hypothetical protein ACE3JK_01065 [Sporolactobacillus sp.]